MPASTAEADGSAHAVGSTPPDGTPGDAQGAEARPAADGDAAVQKLLHSLLVPLKRRPQPGERDRASAAAGPAFLKGSPNGPGPSAGQPPASQQDNHQQQQQLPPPAQPPRQRPPVRREGHSQSVLHAPRPLPQAALSPRLDNGVRAPPHPFDPAAARAAWGHEYLPPGPNHHPAHAPPPYRVFPNAALPQSQGDLPILSQRNLSLFSGESMHGTLSSTPMHGTYKLILAHLWQGMQGKAGRHGAGTVLLPAPRTATTGQATLQACPTNSSSTTRAAGSSSTITLTVIVPHLPTCARVQPPTLHLHLPAATPLGARCVLVSLSLNGLWCMLVALDHMLCPCAVCIGASMLSSGPAPVMGVCSHCTDRQRVQRYCASCHACDRLMSS